MLNPEDRIFWNSLSLRTAEAMSFTLKDDLALLSLLEPTPGKLKVTVTQPIMSKYMRKMLRGIRVRQILTNEAQIYKYCKGFYVLITRQTRDFMRKRHIHKHLPSIKTFI